MYEGKHSKIKDDVLYIRDIYVKRCLDYYEEDDWFAVYHPDYTTYLQEIDADEFAISIYKTVDGEEILSPIDDDDKEDCYNLLLTLLDDEVEDHAGEYGWDVFDN